MTSLKALLLFVPSWSCTTHSCSSAYALSIYAKCPLCIRICVSGWPLTTLIGFPAINLSISSSHIPALTIQLSCLFFCQLDLSQLFGGFKDKKILIELLCNSSSHCINRELDINHPAFVCLHLFVCACVCGYVFFLPSVVKSLFIDPARSSCDQAPYPWGSFLLTHASSMWVSAILCVSNPSWVLHLLILLLATWNRPITTKLSRGVIFRYRYIWLYNRWSFFYLKMRDEHEPPHFV